MERLFWNLHCYEFVTKEKIYNLITDIKVLQFNNEQVHKLISPNTVFLYTNKPITFAIKYQKKILSPKNIFSKKTIVKIMIFTFNNSIFKFKKQIYKQIYGCSNLIIADFISTRKWLYSYLSLKFWLFHGRYVDDI